MQKVESEIHEDIVIVGAGIAGLTTALGLHRLRVRSLVLESSDSLRITGYALTLWTNAWRALDAVGVGDILREKSHQVRGLEFISSDSSLPGSVQAPKADVKFGKVEIRCVKRKDLSETLERQLPKGAIRYSSKIVSVEESGNFKLLQLADGSVVKTKVLIGCDGVNSIVAKWLGLRNPVNVGRSAIRGIVDYPDGHGFKPKFHFFFAGGVRYGFLPCDDKSIYWFFTHSPLRSKYDENDQTPLKMKQFVMSNLHNAPAYASDVVQKTKLDCISCVPLRFRPPWNVLLGNVVKNNVCVVGDALHPMTPDIGQGGCSALEDSVVLARCLAQSLSTEPTCNGRQKDEDYVKMRRGLEKYSKERRWRSFSLISTAYIVGMIQESDAEVMRFLRKKFLSRWTVRTMVKMADFDCGKLTAS